MKNRLVSVHFFQGWNVAGYLCLCCWSKFIVDFVLRFDPAAWSQIISLLKVEKKRSEIYFNEYPCAAEKCALSSPRDRSVSGGPFSICRMQQDADWMKSTCTNKEVTDIEVWPREDDLSAISAKILCLMITCPLLPIFSFSSRSVFALLLLSSPPVLLPYALLPLYPVGVSLPREARHDFLLAKEELKGYFETTDQWVAWGFLQTLCTCPVCPFALAVTVPSWTIVVVYLLISLLNLFSRKWRFC